MKIAIIGATGKMGQWFCKEFLSQNFEVVGIGRNAEKLRALQENLYIPVDTDFAAGVGGADFVVLAVPLGNLSEVVQSIVDAVKSGTILLDILSVKGNVLPALGEICQAAGVSYVSTHPMFGPGADSIEGRNIIVTPLPEFPDAAEKVKALFIEMGARVSETDATFHDQMMGYVLSLPHFLNILFGAILTDSGFDVNTLKQLGGTTFALQEFVALNVNREDPIIYGAIQMENAQFREILIRVQTFLGEYLDLIDRKDSSAFTEIMEVNREFLNQDPMSSRAYEIFYQLLDLLRGRIA
ncbi:MAG TPA: prephenate dehydrogenase/arogenate dehydrogenase family protein [Candidatus Lokiarchaeia archaeon]|nr:prephenate dehydrogenase/arogenate dehydrogenase family protein [Candidatus Lokiarchaeia archaeon]